MRRPFLSYALSTRPSPGDRRVFHFLLESFDRLCTAANVSYFLYSGALLGAYRSVKNPCTPKPLQEYLHVRIFPRIGDILPWDDDVDLAISAKEAEALQIEADQSVRGKVRILRQ